MVSVSPCASTCTGVSWTGGPASEASPPEFAARWQPAMKKAVVENRSARSRAEPRLTTRISFGISFNRIPQFRRAFVGFGSDRVIHLALHLLEFGQRLFRANFLEPLIQKCELGAVRRRLGARVFVVERVDALDALLDFF